MRFKLSNESAMVNFADFKTYDEAMTFMGWFNNTRVDKERVRFTDICRELGYEFQKELAEPYHNFGYIDPIQFGMIHESNNSDIGKKFRVCFPMKVCNFAQMENE